MTIDRETGRELEETLQRAVHAIIDEPMSKDSVERSLESTRSLLEAELPETKSSRGATGVWLGRVAVVLAASLLIAVALWPQAPSLASVVSALRSQEWIHVVSLDPDGSQHETWFSAPHEIVAKRSNGRVGLADYSSKYRFSYDENEDVIEKVPMTEAETRSYSRYETLVERLPKLLEGDSSTSLGSFQDVLGATQDQRLNRIEDASGEWFELVVRSDDPRADAPIEHRFRVDPETLLLQTWTVNARVNGLELKRHVAFDYPAVGPRDLYALGVPTEVLVVDRSLPPDVAKVVAAIEEGRAEFDNYHAVVVETAADKPWWEGRVLQVWRKGEKWRVERATQYPNSVPDNNEIDPMEWWLETAGKLPHRPQMMCDGATTYRKRDGAWKALPSAPPFPIFYGSTPEYVCRPPLGIPNANVQPRLSDDNKDGPPGSIALKLQTGGRTFQRFFIDPKKNILVQWAAGGGGTPNSIEKTAKSPRGHWYAKEVRRVGASRPTDKRFPVRDLIVRFYVDFDAELPDRLFDPGE